MDKFPTYDFGFRTEKLTKEEADFLLRAIMTLVDGLGGTMGGGFSVAKDEEE